MSTWEEGQEQAQRESRNRIFGGTRSLGGATGPTRDMSSAPNPGRGNNPFANLRSSGAGGGGIQPNYGMGASRYPAGGNSINFGNSITGPASSRAMRRGGRGGGGDFQGNITVQFGDQSVDQSVRTGDVLGANARQDNSINVDASSRTVGDIGNRQSQNASARTGDNSPGGASGPAVSQVTKAPRGPSKAETKHRAENPDWKPEDGIPVNPETGKPLWGRGSGTPRGPRSSGGRAGDATAGTNTARMSGNIDVDLSSGRRGSSVFDDGPSTTTAVDSPTTVGSNNTSNPSQQMGDNPTTTTTTNNTTNNNTPPGSPPTTPPSGGTTSPPPVGVPPRSTGRPTPTSGGTPTGATPPAGGRPTIPVPPAGTPPTGGTPPAGGGRPSIPVQPPQRPGRLRSWLSGRGEKPMSDAEYEGAFPTEVMPTPTEVMPTTPSATRPTRPNPPAGSSGDEVWDTFNDTGLPMTELPEGFKPVEKNTSEPEPDFIGAYERDRIRNDFKFETPTEAPSGGTEQSVTPANTPSEKVTLTDPVPPKGKEVTLTDPVPPKGEKVTLTDPVKKEPAKKQAPRKTAAPKKDAEKKPTAKKEPAKKAPAKPKAEPEKKPTAEKPQAEKKDLPKPEDVEVFINPDTGMPDTRPKKK